MNREIEGEAKVVLMNGDLIKSDTVTVRTNGWVSLRNNYVWEHYPPQRIKKILHEE